MGYAKRHQSKKEKMRGSNGNQSGNSSGSDIYRGMMEVSLK